MPLMGNGGVRAKVQKRTVSAQEPATGKGQALPYRRRITSDKFEGPFRQFDPDRHHPGNCMVLNRRRASRDADTVLSPKAVCLR